MLRLPPLAEQQAHSASRRRLEEDPLSFQEACNAMDAARAEGRPVGTAAEERTRLVERIQQESLDLALAPLGTLPDGTRRVLIIESMCMTCDFMSDRLQSRQVDDIDQHFQLPAENQASVMRAWDGMARECISLDSGARPDCVDQCERTLCSGQFHAVILADASNTELALLVLERELGPHLVSIVLAGGALAVTSCNSSQASVTDTLSILHHFSKVSIALSLPIPYNPKSNL
jgi:hypothetical protein